jgi:glycosyltransferase involved in cell wall biosynthesis
MKIAFLVNDLQLSGGVGVVIQHARRLSLMDDWDVTLVLVREDEGPSWRGYQHLPDLHVRSRREATADHFDVAVATWWETTLTLFDMAADRYAYFVQSLEDRFYRYDEAGRLGATATIDLPVAFITEAHWIAETLAQLRPDAPCHLVPNGIDKEIFAPPAETDPATLDRPLRILVEGSPRVWFKHVSDAVRATEYMREPHHVTVVCGDRDALGEVSADEVVGPLDPRQMADVYRRTDVVLKLSSVEGVFGPPLEGFHCGATCVVTPVTGHEEYVEHGHNGLLTDWDDLRGTARQLDLLARDRELLRFLRENALRTARAWPDWEQSSRVMATALLAVRDGPEPNVSAASSGLLTDLRSGIEIQEVLLSQRRDWHRRARRFERPIERVGGDRVFRRALMLRSRAARLATGSARRFTRRPRS